ncbi:hypothetical protein C4J81_06260 [Deltaproteobacteria bacterium Smac51]|nr:hypothetical protein C4J81_06260 [Deltaproteobacteria bacterium Smac51]
MRKAVILFWLILFVWAAPAAGAAPGQPTGAPDSLAAWEPWVLYGYEDHYYCPDVNGQRRCAWPVKVSVDLNSGGGTFTATFDLLTKGTFTLPGGPAAWPREVTDESGRAVPVLGKDWPQVWLPAGRHILSGRYEWPRLPETINVPFGFILELKVDGRSQEFPAMEADYSTGSARLWLKNSSDDEAAATVNTATSDSLSVLVNRLIQDSQPMIIKSRFRLIVTGRAREVVLENVLLPDTRATYLSSPLPAQLTGQGLRVKLKPGVHEIFLDSRSLTHSESLGPVSKNNQRSREFWAFQAQPQLRLAEVSGAEQIDPSQADIYPAWRSFPIYVMEPGQQLTFTTLRRGDPEPPPDQLSLARECWLDYDGHGLSCRDRLNGTLNRQWHLNTSRPFVLAQAALGGQPQVITWQTDSKGEEAPGLQLRNGQVNLSADLRIDDWGGVLPASGWDHKLDIESQRLNLPPGYHIFHASGADVRQDSHYSGSGTWTGAWGTLDFFIILIISIAVWKLYGLKWGLLALAALIFCYHEPMAPRMVFLHLLACAALLRLLPPTGKIRLLVRVWRFGAVLTLLVLSSLFLINQARVSMYPQLEDPRAWYDDPAFRFGLPGSSAPKMYDYDYGEATMYEPELMVAAEAPMPPSTVQNTFEGMRQDSLASSASGAAPAKRMQKDSSLGSIMPAAPSQVNSYANRLSGLSIAPDAKVQNSLARPSWKWRSVRLYYNGSVTADQTVRLYLIPPGLWKILGLARIILMTVFTLMMLESGRFAVRSRLEEGGESENRPKRFRLFSGLGAAVLAAMLASSPGGAALAADSFPEQAMLDSLRARLLAERDMPPAGLPKAVLTIEPERLLMELEVEAARPTVVPLPSLDPAVFRYSRVSLGGTRDLPLIQDNSGLMLSYVPPGRHRLLLEGRLRLPSGRDSFQINFFHTALPRQVAASGGERWKIEGLEADGQLRGEALFISATGGAAAGPDADEATSVTLEPFFMVQRTISLGLEWQVHTLVRRLTPTGAPVSLRLPLLPGELPLGADFRRDGDLMTVNFAPGAEEVRWTSRLDTTPEISLKAADGPFTESWSLDVSPLWRVSFTGLTPIHTINNGYWQPSWRPWPGEELTVAIDRPQPVPGEYLVIDEAGLTIDAAENMRSATLSFKIRTSQAGPYSFGLPPAVEVRGFTVDGRSVPLAPSLAAVETDKEAGPVLTASLSAGSHDVVVTWVEDKPISAVMDTPELNLGAPTANISITLNLPEDRWILRAWGPMNGPAVRFWSLLAVVLIAAVILGRQAKTPLRWWAWFLLGIGLIQLNILGAMLVAGWLLMLGWRAGYEDKESAFKFNAGQILLTVWTFAALYLIYKGIEYGLLSNPDMLIDGGGSYGQRLRWFTDRSSGPWPSGHVFSVSVWFYKAIMLAWSLWLAVNLIRWLKWGWQAFSGGRLWKKGAARIKKAENPAKSTILPKNNQEPHPEATEKGGPPETGEE